MTVEFVDINILICAHKRGDGQSHAMRLTRDLLTQLTNDSGPSWSAAYCNG